MKLFPAGQNGLHRIISELNNGKNMVIYLAGGVSGNLKPAWNKTARRDDISLTAFCEELQNENFWRGGSQDIGCMMT